MPIYFFIILFGVPLLYTGAACFYIVRTWSRAKVDPSLRRTAWVRTMLWTSPLLLIALNRLYVAALDFEVDRRCAVDGGVKIYETIFLPKENFGPHGEVFPQYRTRLSSEGRYSSAYRSRSEDDFIVKGDPSLRRLNTVIYRVSDDKVMGETVLYVRNGGDLPGPWLGSSHACPKAVTLDIERELFKPQEQ